MATTFAIRPMVQADVVPVAELQTLCYPPSLHEAADKYAARLRACPAACFVAEMHTGAMCGYVQAHPWRCDSDPPCATDGDVPELPASCDVLFLFDLATAPSARGLGVAAALWRAVESAARAQGLAEVRLVAVGSADAFWARLGFQPLGELPPGSGYADERAVYMSLALQQ